MPVEFLDIQHLRNIESARLELSPQLNLIIGLNASGKTSLLEAISLLIQGKSFRTPRIDQLIQHNHDEMVVVGQYRQETHRYRVGLARKQRRTQVRLNGEVVSKTTDLVGHLPLFILTPESHELLDSGPKMRRQYLDWGVFHVEHRYLDAWQRYHRILRQRNSSLRQQASISAVQAWDIQLAEYAQQIHEFREHYLEMIGPKLSAFSHELLGLDVTINYQAGWDPEVGIAEQLQHSIDKDLSRGFTSLGPHRADLKFKQLGNLIQSVFSRGQQKLFICAMTLAQMAVLPKSSLILVDDLPAELDPHKRHCLMLALQSTGAQVVVTATESGLINTDPWPDKKLFHVEHGKVQEVL